MKKNNFKITALTSLVIGSMMVSTGCSKEITDLNENTQKVEESTEEKELEETIEVEVEEAEKVEVKEEDPLEELSKSVNQQAIEREGYDGYYYKEEEIVEVLGQPSSKSEAIEQGYGGTHQNWIYEEDGIEIEMTKFDEDEAYGSSYITFKSPFKYKTSEGIGIGSTREELERAYKDIIEAAEEQASTVHLKVQSDAMVEFKDNQIVSVTVGQNPN